MSLIPGAGRASGMSGFSNGTAASSEARCWFRATQGSPAGPGMHATSSSGASQAQAPQVTNLV